MNNEKLILENEGLIHYSINKLGIKRRDDLYEELYEEGLEALVKCSKYWNPELNYKPSTYFYKVIHRKQILYLIYLKRKKRNFEGKIISLDKEMNKEMFDYKTIGETIADERINIEEEIINKIDKEIKLDQIKKIVDQFKEKDKYIFCSYYGIYGYKQKRPIELIKEFNFRYKNSLFAVIRKCEKKIRKEVKNEQ